MDVTTSVELATKLFIALQVGNGIVILYLQLAAYRRNRHSSFVILAVSTVVALACLALMFLPSLGLMHRSLASYFASVAAYAVYTVLAIWGTVSLFRSYGKLASAASTRHF